MEKRAIQTLEEKHQVIQTVVGVMAPLIEVSKKGPDCCSADR
jgi:hypothetical protein